MLRSIIKVFECSGPFTSKDKRRPVALCGAAQCNKPAADAAPLHTQ